jgi:hypothetical protein
MLIVRPTKESIVLGLIRIVAAALLVAGCTGAGLTADERPITAEEMPVTFAYGGLGPDRASYHAAIERHRGTEIRRMVMHTGSELAVFDVVTLLGDIGFVQSGKRGMVDGLLGQDKAGKATPVSWQEAGRLGGTRATAYETFAAHDGRMRCVALERSLREHIEAALDDYSQERVTGFYCRGGAAPMTRDEVARIADALQAKR